MTRDVPGTQQRSPAAEHLDHSFLREPAVRDALHRLGQALPHCWVAAFGELSASGAIALGGIAAALPPEAIWLQAFWPTHGKAIWEVMPATTDGLPPLLPLPYVGPQLFYGVAWQGARESSLQGVVVSTPRPLTPAEQLCIRQQGALLQGQAAPTAPADPAATCRAMAHQIQTPLSLLELYTTLLDQAPEACAPNVMQTLGQAIQQIQDTLTRFCRQGAPQPQRENHTLTPILAAVLQTLAPWIEAKALQVTWPEDDLRVYCDRWQLHQVLLNVLNNGVQFSPFGSQLTCHWTRAAAGVLIQVQDQGPGVTAADSQQIFQPAYSRREGGNGLGLAIARRFVLAHQGHIWAEALPTGGTQVSILLPH